MAGSYNPMLLTDSRVGSLSTFIFLTEAELNWFDHIKPSEKKKKSE